MTSLYQIWSIDGSSYATAAPYLAHLSSDAPAPANFEAWFVSHIFMGHYSAYYLTKLLEIVPSSEIRLRNDGLIAMYNVIRGINITFNAIAKQRGIAVPPHPDLAVDWEDEAGADYNALHAVVATYGLKSTVDYMEYTIGLIQDAEKYHWTSLVTPVSVSTDLFLESAKAETGPAVTGSMVREAMTDNHMTGPARVLDEELMRIRGNAEESGWREEEARKCTEGHLKYVEEFFTQGS